MKRTRFRRFRFLIVLFYFAIAAIGSVARVAAAQPASTIAPSEYLVLPAVGQYGRLPLHRDALEAQLATGAFKIPAAGDALTAHDGRREAWRSLPAAENGLIDTEKFRGGYALAKFDSPTQRIMMLEATGHAMVFVNGEPRAGDPYQLGWLRLPVLVRKGENVLLFHLAADKLTARLVEPPQEAFFSADDCTLPTLVRGETDPVWAAIPVINATTDWLDELWVASQIGDEESTATPVPPIPPLSVLKVPVEIRIAEPQSHNIVPCEFRLTRTKPLQSNDQNKPLATTQVELKRVGPADVHIRTFRSRIDGSIQPYAVRPASERDGETRPAIVVALHDAGANCNDHIAYFTNKEWAHVVAPQGRRAEGFDWETWAAKDALEALGDAQSHYNSDPQRTYLTGYSMGGHGAWHLGVSYPDHFTAIGPSSSWISFWSYGGGMSSAEAPTAIDALLLRGYSASDTLKLLSNLGRTGIYVLHGAADQVVPVAQARFTRSRLATFHPNFVYYEQAGADHWWGNECCDWQPMMEYFQHQSTSLPEEQDVIDFSTANPAVSSRCHWVGIEAQDEQLSPSHVTIRQNTDARTFAASTTNVARLSIEVGHLTPNQPIDVTLDGQPLHWLAWPSTTRRLWFQRQGDEWAATEPPGSQVKGPRRYGTFNAAIDNDVLLVYGTKGTDDENAWAAAKARFDAETFYYRGGGALEVLPDTRFDFNSDADRSVILYGNADTNLAWSQLLATSPVDVRRGQVRVGTRTLAGEDLAILTVRPRSGSDVALVGVVGGTGPAGMRLTNRLRWFVSGIVYPDLMILGPDTLTKGTSAVRAWGFFGLDWQPDGSEIAWQDESL